MSPHPAIMSAKYQFNLSACSMFVLKDDHLEAQLTGRPPPEQQDKFFYKRSSATRYCERDGARIRSSRWACTRTDATCGRPHNGATHDVGWITVQPEHAGRPTEGPLAFCPCSEARPRR